VRVCSGGSHCCDGWLNLVYGVGGTIVIMGSEVVLEMLLLQGG
jgi:hypothetical protein